MNIISDTMEKYCKSCGRVFKNSDFRICPYCGNQLSARTGRQPIPRKLRHQVFQRDGYRCRECGATNKQTRLHVDHIKPVAKGGTNDLSNLQTLCEECNKAKYTDEWVGGVNKRVVNENLPKIVVTGEVKRLGEGMYRYTYKTSDGQKGSIYGSSIEDLKIKSRQYKIQWNP